jgi:hypothetical protein
MPTQYSQSRARGFSRLSRGPYSDQHVRVSDAERQAVVDRLAGHFGDGRLDHAEFDERVGRAMSATTRADLDGLLDDLPDTGAPAAMDHPRRRHRHPALLIALIVVLAVAAAHAVLWVTVPLLWLTFGVAAVVFATRALGHSRSGHDR